ncbi:thioesterase domain-containing protein, partial [Dyella mobilis]
ADTAAAVSPIGERIPDLRLYLLDAQGQPVPLGAVGELYVGGAGVARGYLNRPELTAERFLPDPFSPHPDARMYRSGDLARYLPDGNLVFLGRNDHQVKIRGFRIELGEIEARLAEHDAIRDAVVLAREDVPGDKRLVAYVTTEGENSDLAAALRAHLSARLPDYMVPSAFVQLEALPLTPNGKLDRKALPAPDGEAYARHVYEAPQGDIERILATLWEELLGIARVSRRDNFFELGGHSLLAVQLLHRTTELGLSITLNELFESPVLHELAARFTNPTECLDWNRAVPIRKSGTQAPIFFLPTGTGDRSYIFSLANDIHRDHPIYSLPWPSAREEQPPSLEAMTPRLVSMMQAVQPSGPYRLAGYSAGGLLAYAVAHHLSSIDESVSFIGLIDTQLLSDREPKSAKEIIVDIASVLGGEKQNSQIDLQQMAEEMTLEDLITEATLLKRLPAYHDVHGWKQVCHFMQIAYSYRAPSSDLMTHLFCAQEIPPALKEELVRDGKLSHLDDESIHANTENLKFLIGPWHEALPPSSMPIIPVPGNHITMMSEPDNRKVLGDAMSNALQSIA